MEREAAYLGINSGRDNVALLAAHPNSGSSVPPHPLPHGGNSVSNHQPRWAESLYFNFPSWYHATADFVTYTRTNFVTKSAYTARIPLVYDECEQPFVPLIYVVLLLLKSILFCISYHIPYGARHWRSRVAYIQHLWASPMAKFSRFKQPSQSKWFIKLFSCYVCHS